jgi:DNA polymerase type B, organellar and viral
MGNPETCGDCNRIFNGSQCVANHLSNNICKHVKKCVDCGMIKPKLVQHICNQTYCSHCRKYRPIPHYCYIAPLPKNKSKKETLYVYYDFECRQDELIVGSNEKYMHTPNLCVAFQKCAKCPALQNAEDININCNYCGVRKHIFGVENTLDNFMNYLLYLDPKFTEVITVAHNMRSYDGHFILKSILENPEIKPEIVLNGAQIFGIFFSRFKFIDSLNYFNTALSKLPAMFGIEGAIKGYYPHLWNTKDHENSPPGPLPDKKFYMPEGMMAKDRENFEKWYHDQNSVSFDNFAELTKYCENDVYILMEACVRFQALFKDVTDFDIFKNSVTIASACNKVFRTNFLKEDTIPIIPKNGYRLRNNQSKVALKWLYWVQHSRGLMNLEHAGNGRERRLLDKYFVDGFDPQGGPNKKGKVYEMLGDYWHQCPLHMGNRPPSVEEMMDPNFVPQTNMALRYEETMARINILREHYEVEYIWECQFKKVQATAEYQEFERTHSHYWETSKLNPRDSLTGGRVNNLKIFKKADETVGEKLMYKDITSLYPFVNREKAYTISHPKKVYHGPNIQDFDIEKMDGLVKLKILAPDDLYIPVLGQKMHDKLMFYLCHLCALTKAQCLCEHSDLQRSFVGTFVIEEVRLALKKGYKILEIYEAWTYDLVQKSEDGSSPGLFAGYINLFLKIKQEASGYPEWVKTPGDKVKYIKLYKEKEGIDLDPAKIIHNEGLRSLAKLCLNNFWGKFGEKEGKRSTVIVKDRQTLNDYITNPKIKVKAIIPINDEVLILHYKQVDEEISPLNFANVVIAAFTTAYGRMELYSYLDKLGSRVQYFDTDAVIFSIRPGQDDLEVSDFLGGMTDELEKYGPGSYAVEFVSGGPKNYALKIWSTKANDYVTMCKVKGITLNSENMRFINFETIKRMILESESPREIVLVNKNKINRSLGLGVWSSTQEKTYKTVLTKRVRDGDSFDTVPYGKKRKTS